MTRQYRDTTTLQLWPGGQGITFRGDPWGPKNQRSVRGGAPDAHWRKGTREEWRQIRIEILAERYLAHEVFACDSALVGDLLKASSEYRGDLSDAFQIYEIRNLYPDPSEWDAAQCRAYLEDHGIAVPDAPDDPDADDDPAYVDMLRGQIQDNAEAAEVFEWWRVSGWLCDQLHNAGEVTLDNGYGCWWGRTCTGQGIIMDGTLQQIAARFVAGEDR